MRIRVNSPAGLHNRKAGFAAWGPGEYEFPDDPEYAGWLQGQVEQGIVTILGDEPANESAPAGERPDPADVAGFVVGARVSYTAKNGSEHAAAIKGVNGDGTFNLGGILKKVPQERIRLLGPEE